MKQDTLLVQCILQDGDSKTTAWIEAKKASIGKQILTSDSLDKTKEKRWWTIISVGNEKVEYSVIASKRPEDINDNPINKMRGNK